MKNSKLVSIIFFIVLIIITLTWVIFYYLKQSSHSIKVENISDISEAYDVKTCAQKFYLYCKDYRISAPSSIYDLLDKEYIKKYKISINNIKEYIDQTSSDTYKISEVYKLQQKSNLSLYLVKGYELYRNKDEIKEFNFILKIDKQNNTFSIFLNNYINEKKYNEIKIGDEISFKLNSIKQNYNNTFAKSNNNMYDNVKDLFSDYRYLCMFYERYSYEVLSEEDRNQKFKNYEEYDKYILSVYKDLVMSKFAKYETDVKNDKVIYTCYDNYGKKYIFDVKSYITYNVSIVDN